jgi:hypothetical protein
MDFLGFLFFRHGIGRGRQQILICRTIRAYGRSQTSRWPHFPKGDQGTKPSEGDAPSTFVVTYEKLSRFSKAWREVRAYAEDSARRKYFSKKPPRSPVPSWAETR